MSFYKPTFDAASFSCVLICLHKCVCADVFTQEGFSEDPYSGRCMPRAHEHICLSRTTGTSSVLECVRVCIFLHVREVWVNSDG